MIRFLLIVVVVSAGMLATARMALATPPSWDIAIVTFLLITTASAYFLLKKIEGEKFTRIYLLSITLKILLSCAFVIMFVLIDREGADINAIFFLVGYVIFTSLEVGFLLLKKNS